MRRCGLQRAGARWTSWAKVPDDFTAREHLFKAIVNRSNVLDVWPYGDLA